MESKHFLAPALVCVMFPYQKYTQFSNKQNVVPDQDAHCLTFHYHLLHTSPDSQMDFNVLDNS